MINNLLYEENPTFLKQVLIFSDFNVLSITQNKNNQWMIESFFEEDDDKGYLYYLHTIISLDTLKRYILREISYKTVLSEASIIFLIKKRYNYEIVDVSIKSYDSFDNEELPLKSSFLPDYSIKALVKSGFIELNKII